ncbi:SUN domain-containing 2 [Hyphodiscus hymeniophilus]|uniref:SUN domain-containing 2 n=1 Tax=Hyphodiscus hymeniophilus TaxID=353542 RepID=A0A9P6VSE1_9HELO|nr:SUN domain-containing 2 [Hyphodiscus hymeniophilus]
MSTIRTTRSTTRAASSRGASPALTESSIPATPSAKSKRTGGPKTPLPTIAGRLSTSYGTNATHQPASLNVPESGQEVDNVLGNILQPQGITLPTVREEDTSSEKSRDGRPVNTRRYRHGRADPVIVDRSYGNESQIFGHAGFEDSSVASPIQDPPPPPAQHMRPSSKSRQERQRLDREQTLQEHARTPVIRARKAVANTSKSIFERMTWSVDKSLDLAASLGLQLRKVSAWIKKHVTILSILSVLTLTLLLLNPGSYRWYGFDLKHNVGQFVPDFMANPGSAFSPTEIRDLQFRIKTAEYDIAYLKKRGEIDEKAIAHLKALLPDHVIVKKTSGGKLEITQDFWHALDAKMRSESAYLRPTAGKTSDASITDVSLPHIETLMEKSKMWDRYLQNNRIQLKAWAGEEFDARFPEKFRDSIEVTKSDFIELIRENWEDSQNEITKEIRRLSSQFDDTARHVQHAEGNVVGHTREQIKAISTDVFKSLLSTTQLEALARANKNINAAATKHRLNHFSPLTGAAINPKLTSPNYLFPSMDRNFLVRTLSRAIWQSMPTPNPPIVALQRWEEHGDCWCAPSKGADGFGASLTVNMASNIYPDQIIIEHMPPSGSMEPGAAPKDMELLAYIEDSETYHTIKQRSEEIFYDEILDEPLPFGFVRIGTWTYDSHSMSNIQSFPLQIELGMIKGPSYTNRLSVRSKNNWGEGEVDYTCLYRVRVNGEVAKI